MIKKLAITSLQELTQLSKWVTNLAMELNLKVETINKTQIILDDFVANIFMHNDNKSSLNVKVEALIIDNNLVFKITDNGKAFNLLESETPDVTSNLEEREIGGLGLHLVKSLANKVDYVFKKNQNINTITIHQT